MNELMVDNKGAKSMRGVGRGYYFTFLAIVLIICSDINNLVSSIYSTTEVLSIPILIGTLVLLMRSFSEGIQRISLSGFLFHLTFLWLLLYGGLVSELYHLPGQNTLSKWRYYLPGLLLVYTSMRFSGILIRNQRIDSVYSVFAFAFVLNCLFIISNSIFGLSIYGSEGGGDSDRSGGLIDSVNHAGMIASLGQLFILSILLNPDVKIKAYFLYVAYSLCVVASFLTFSKAAFGNVFIILIIFLISKKETNAPGVGRRVLKRRIIGFLFFLAFILILASSNFVRMFADLTDEQQNRILQFSELMEGRFDSETTTKRTDAGLLALDYISDNYIMGHGLGTFHSFSLIGIGAHNEYLMIWGEAGLFGLIFYILFLISLWIMASGVQAAYNRFLLRGFCVFLIASSFVTHNILGDRFLLLVIGFALAILANGRSLKLKF